LRPGLWLFTVSLKIKSTPVDKYVAGEFMAAGQITFIECPWGDTFPVRKISERSSGIQHIVCPDCGKTFDVCLPESVERLSSC
jgi:transposase-like protein